MLAVARVLDRFGTRHFTLRVSGAAREACRNKIIQPVICRYFISASCAGGIRASES